MAEEYRNWLAGPGSVLISSSVDSGGGQNYTYGPDPTWKPPEDLPSTKYGPYTNVRQYDVPSSRGVGGFELINHDLWYNDPNYGPITPAWNTIDPESMKNGYDMIGPIFAAVLGTAIGIPWYATAGLSAAKAVGGADKENPMAREVQQYQEGASSFSSSASPTSSTSSPSIAPSADTTDLNSLVFSAPSLDLLAPTDSTKKEQGMQGSQTPSATDGTSLYDTLQASNKRLITLYSFLSSDKKQV